MDVAVLDVHQDIAGGKPGEKLAIELSAGAATVSLHGETADASGSIFGEASDIKVKPVLAVLREKGPVTVKMGETSATLAEQVRARIQEQLGQIHDADVLVVEETPGVPGHEEDRHGDGSGEELDQSVVGTNNAHKYPHRHNLREPECHSGRSAV